MTCPKIAAGSRTCDLLTTSSDVVLETRVLVLRRLEDKNESLGLGLEIKVLVLKKF